ncbi:hypothetical protein [Halorubrum sp. SP9]|uniref:hypothetical protein n=1 Tax=Halorubrum sp. SP9 TaxID=1537267 RepID=UPI0010F9876C|nr:hypothetical protein [Halorubrum sp. SP9]
MPCVTRRALLRCTGLAATVSVAGCGLRSDDDVFPSAGSLGFANLDDLPHRLGVRVVDAPETYRTDDGDERGVPLPQRHLHASVSLRPGDTVLYPDAFTEPIEYEVKITVDGAPPRSEDAETVSFDPQAGEAGQYLSVVTGETGETTWVVTTAGVNDHYDQPAEGG